MLTTAGAALRTTGAKLSVISARSVGTTRVSARVSAGTTGGLAAGPGVGPMAQADSAAARTSVVLRNMTDTPVLLSPWTI